MKKPLAYSAGAILLGFIVMMLPLALETGLPTSQPQSMNTPTEQGDTKGYTSALRSLEIAGKPSTLIPSSLIFFSGLIVSFSVYIIVKKRM